jgi:NADH pyrophosphatase NudC (nudix superfamily)
MTADDKALKARLMAEAEKAINKLMAEKGEKEELQLSDIERLVRTAGQQMMERFTVGVVEAEAEGEDCRVCPECGRRMRYKGHKGRNLVTESGEVWLERAYYYCPTCRKGVFPPRPTMESE